MGEIICFILVADHITAEYLSFNSFGNKCNLIAEMGIEAIEFISWNGLENILWNTSIKNFEKGLIDKWEQESPWKLGDLLSLSFEKSNSKPKINYFDEAENEIFEGAEFIK